MEAFSQLLNGQIAGILNSLAKAMGYTPTAPIHDLQQPSSSQLAAERSLLNDCSLTLVYKLFSTQCTHGGVSFETPIVYQFPGELPTELLSVIIPVKYVILKSKLS